jgi:carbon storage regulator
MRRSTACITRCRSPDFDTLFRMLILSRKPGESIVIDGRIVVKIMRLDGEIVKLGIEAPTEIPVHRQEVYIEIQKNNQEAMIDTKAKLPRLAASADSLSGSNDTSASANSGSLVPERVSGMIKSTARN